MAIKAKKTTTVFTIVCVLTILLCFSATGAKASIPEPDNIIYGIARHDAVTITLRIDDQTIASYTMGDNPDAGEFYILRVPMDAIDPIAPGSARPDYEADLYVNDGQAPFASLTLGDRGSVYRLDMNDGDMDNDGLQDDWEQQIIDAMALVWKHFRLLIETSSATVIAAILASPEDFADKRVAAIISGGNVDLDTLPF